MAQIKSKQIKLAAQGDLIIGDVNASGSVLGIGADRQVLISDGTTADWEYIGQLRDSAGNLVVDAVLVGSPVNYLEISSGATGSGPVIEAVGSDTDIDINLTVKGTGEVLVPIGYTPISDNALVTKEYVDSISAFSFVTINADVGFAQADAPADTLTIAGGSGITTVGEDSPDTITIELDINDLVLETIIDVSVDTIAFYDDSEGETRKAVIRDVFEAAGVGQVSYNEVVASGSADESFPGFFTTEPIDGSVTVFFNGLALRGTGWVVSGTTLTLIDSVNGYSTEAGDVISARYEYTS